MLMRYRDPNGQGWAGIIDLLTMYPMRGPRRAITARHCWNARSKSRSHFEFGPVTFPAYAGAMLE
jgi:hypothetical protein